jgi:preprotein translocase subunit YajC
MFATPALAQPAAGAPAAGGSDMFVQLIQFAPLLAVAVMFYFLIMRPQQLRQKKHQEQIGGIKRGDTVVLNSGVIGQVARVDDTEVTVEIARGVEVKVVKSMVADVRTRGQPVVANDSKPKGQKA